MYEKTPQVMSYFMVGPVMHEYGIHVLFALHFQLTGFLKSNVVPEQTIWNKYQGEGS